MHSPRFFRAPIILTICHRCAMRMRRRHFRRKNVPSIPQAARTPIVRLHSLARALSGTALGSNRPESA